LKKKLHPNLSDTLAYPLETRVRRVRFATAKRAYVGSFVPSGPALLRG